MVTGYRGRLGRELVKLGAKPFDPLDQFLPDAPATVIHAAAMTNVDECEEHANHAIYANVNLVRDVVRLLRPDDRLVYLSTDFVFDGRNGPHHEKSESFGPLNIYGATKWLGEKLVRESGLKHTVIRTTGLYGLYPDRPTFLDWLLAKFAAGERFDVDDSHFTTMTDVKELARVIWQCASDDKFAPTTMNVSSGEVMNKYRFAKQVARIWGYDENLTLPYPHNAPARRPRYGGLENWFMKALGYTMKSTEQSLKEWKEIWDQKR